MENAKCDDHENWIYFLYHPTPSEIQFFSNKVASWHFAAVLFFAIAGVAINKFRNTHNCLSISGGVTREKGKTCWFMNGSSLRLTSVQINKGKPFLFNHISTFFSRICSALNFIFIFLCLFRCCSLFLLLLDVEATWKRVFPRGASNE